MGGIFHKSEFSCPKIPLGAAGGVGSSWPLVPNPTDSCRRGWGRIGVNSSSVLAEDGFEVAPWKHQPASRRLRPRALADPQQLCLPQPCLQLLCRQPGLRQGKRGGKNKLWQGAELVCDSSARESVGGGDSFWIRPKRCGRTLPAPRGCRPTTARSRPTSPEPRVFPASLFSPAVPLAQGWRLKPDLSPLSRFTILVFLAPEPKSRGRQESGGAGLSSALFPGPDPSPASTGKKLLQGFVQCGSLS